MEAHVRWIAIVLVGLVAACEGGNTVAPCNVDGDCEQGFYCRSGIGCDFDCRRDADCEGGRCDLGRGRCGVGGGDTDAGVDAGPMCTSDVQCDDGVFCNGAERCVDGACRAGSPACGGAGCDEATRFCEGCLEPDRDHDGHDRVECGGRDCDDADALIPRDELCDPDDVDEDCDATTVGTRDFDRDGHVDASCCNVAGDDISCGTDCNDRDVAVYPGATEICDGRDQDCDGRIDEDAGQTYYRDFDRDGYGTTETMIACSMPTGWASDPGDCNDMAAAVNPASTESCDGRDNDCNGVVDDILGAECSVGLGACQRFGHRRCDGTCGATAGTPTTTPQTSPATNGSWDWDCDGSVTTEIRSFEARDAVTTAFVGPLTFSTPPTMSFLPYQGSDEAACAAGGCSGSNLTCWPASMSTTPTTCGAELRCLFLRGESWSSSCSPIPSESSRYRSCISSSGSCTRGTCSGGSHSGDRAVYARVSCR
jgi:hypothetical protein